ncbi:cytochrome P450 [Nocardioides sp. J9]|nr:cytochrome P450 [Nocardioides sp. J9]
MERTCPFAPPEELERLRDNAPVAPFQFLDGHVGWIVTSHELIRRIMGDPRFSRGASGNPLTPPEIQAALVAQAIDTDDTFPDDARKRVEDLRAESRLVDLTWDPVVVRALHDSPLRILPFSNMDPPHHTRMRRLLTGFFTVRSVTAHRDRITEIVDECLDEMERRGGPVDIVELFAFPIPFRMSCEMLGVPEEMRPALELLSSDRNRAGATEEDVVNVFLELRELTAKVIELRRTEPGDDLLSRLVQDGEMTEVELVSAAVLLTLAAVLTTSNTLAGSIAALLRDREQWDLLVAGAVGPAAATEELLRYTSAVQAAETRTALEDVELAGVTVKAYERLALSLAVANRDEHVFANGGRLDLTRKATNHVTFGHGVHQCLGQQLVRLEVQIAISRLAERFPTLKLAGDITWPNEEVDIHGPVRVPVSW